jgi:type II secretory pathway pseudopilin PulG
MLKKIKKSFSLVEVLVSISVFAVIISIVSAFFISSLRTQNIVFKRQEVLSEISYAMEYISRSIRMATKNTTEGACGMSENENYRLMSASDDVGSGITFVDYSGHCKRFYYDTNTKKFTEGRIISGTTWSDIEITSSEINILSVLFTIEGEDQDDNLQPRVSFIIKSREKGLLFGSLFQSIKTQTSVSQRNIDTRR